MRQLLFALAAIAAVGGPARADEIADSLRAAFEAYEAGEVVAAREEVEYAVQLLAQRKAVGLTALLPEPPEGWSVERGEGQAAMAAMFGGGVTAEGIYTRADGETVELRLIADSPLVASMAAMFASPATMGAMGRVQRIKRVNFAVDGSGDIQGMIGGRVLVQVSGSALEADKVAMLEAMDFAALAAF